MIHNDNVNSHFCRFLYFEVKKMAVVRPFHLDSQGCLAFRGVSGVFE
jgi:hypothetical protein